ncbi:hypothetical protein [Terasakiella pusilla]|uniref:hypothetical protein n=1 Tax=Terasakiella pusilla TaxID=64973 RepID=UPI003AA883E3
MDVRSKENPKSSGSMNSNQIFGSGHSKNLAPEQLDTDLHTAITIELNDLATVVHERARLKHRPVTLIEVSDTPLTPLFGTIRDLQLYIDTAHGV